jgi:hypothetical protein
MLGLRINRLLVVHEFVDQTASHIAQSTEPSQLDAAFSQATARQNIITNLLLGLFESILQDWRVNRRPTWALTQF